MSDVVSELMTIGELATRLGVSTHRLKYAIEQYHIEPTRRVGIIRVWGEDKVGLIESALLKIAENRGGKKVYDYHASDESSGAPRVDTSVSAAVPNQ